MEKLGARAQAAVTDALYFLLIVTGVSVLLFTFSNTYGNSVSTKVTTNHNTTFAADALKTILYSSTPRDPQKSLYAPATEIEVDHLLAFIKEDYSDDSELLPQTKEVLAKDIIGILAPIATNYDYAFYVSVVEEKFVFVFLKTTDVANRVVNYYFCGQNSDYRDFKEKLSKLLVNVGETSSSSSRIKLSLADASGGISAGTNSQVDLVIWNATALETFADDGSRHELIDFAGSDWGCTQFNPV
ncbi:MAG: hypothetical protein HYW50_01035 [Candidatus Diapherotrites archaeon]|nr:hypothetical protein [Candidatus Diapherotrites archaeon]